MFVCLQSDACNHSPYLCTQLRTESPNTGGMCGVCLENSTCDCGAVIPFTAKKCPQCGSAKTKDKMYDLSWGYRHSLRLPYVESAQVSAPSVSTSNHRRICECTDVRCTSHTGHSCQEEIRADAACPPERIHSFCIACNKYHLGWREDNPRERFCGCWSYRMYGCPACALSHRFRPGECWFPGRGQPACSRLAAHGVSKNPFCWECFLLRVHEWADLHCVLVGFPRSGFNESIAEHFNPGSQDEVARVWTNMADDMRPRTMRADQHGVRRQAVTLASLSWDFKLASLEKKLDFSSY